MSYLLDRRIKRISLLTIVLLLSFSSLAFADPDRDSGRGSVRANYRDRDDDDHWEHRDRNPREVRRRAMSFGTRAGFEAGRRDRFYHRGFNYRDEQAFREATLGYRRQMGSFELYRRIFREAFAQAYVQAYRSGGSRW
ncbi:MAG TPA: hypothetical protein VF131_06250 [Blastocatellia bacterium]|nr:hypothetical protein [Blastocatellia bacterium]